MTIHRKNRSKQYILLFLLFATLIEFSAQVKKCVVDQCKKCSYTNIDTCEECESGYYLRTWFGEDKGRDYNACWSIMKLLFSLLGTLLLSLSYLYCCWKAYQKGKSITKIVSDKKPKKVIKDERKFSNPQSDAIAQPQIPSTSRPINLETQPSQQHIPNVVQPAPVNQPYQSPMRPVQPQPVLQSVRAPSPPRVVRTPVSYSPGYARHEPPVTTIIRERPTTIIREIEDSDDYEPQRYVKRKRNMRRKSSTRVVRYEPDSIRNISNEVRRVGSRKGSLRRINRNGSYDRGVTPRRMY